MHSMSPDDLVPPQHIIKDPPINLISFFLCFSLHIFCPISSNPTNKLCQREPPLNRKGREIVGYRRNVIVVIIDHVINKRRL